MKSTITIVLPIHNGERLLRTSVYQILELAEIVGRRVRVVVVDDGSTDETYDAACELARMYPQVCVLRQAYSRGLGPALDEVRRKLAVDQVIVHDGVSPVDIHALADLIKEAPLGSPVRPATVVESRGSRRQAAPIALHPRADGGHRPTISLQWLRLDEPSTPRRRRFEPTAAALTETPAILGGFGSLPTATPSALL